MKRTHVSKLKSLVSLLTTGHWKVSAVITTAAFSMSLAIGHAPENHQPSGPPPAVSVTKVVVEDSAPVAVSTRGGHVQPVVDAGEEQRLLEALIGSWEGCTQLKNGDYTYAYLAIPKSDGKTIDAQAFVKGRGLVDAKYVLLHDGAMRGLFFLEDGRVGVMERRLSADHRYLIGRFTIDGWQGVSVLWRIGDKTVDERICKGLHVTSD